MRTVDAWAPFRRALSAISLAAAVLCTVTAAHAATLEVGPDRKFKQPSEAAAAAHDGDTIRIAAGEYFDCAVWRASNLVIEGAGPDASVITDKVCQGKALFITTGNDITIRGLTLTRARVPDFNGAGIRAEGRNLTVQHVRFVNNQDGILAASSPEGKLLISDSEFLRNGTCEGSGGCAHGLYANNLALVRIERSRFFETRQGHHIKSRAQRTEVIDCDLADGAKGTSSYAVDIPNGGSVVLRGNRIQKGAKSENRSAALMVGAEGVTQRTLEITVENNRFMIDGDYTSYLVVNMTATEAKLKGNVLKGSAQALRGDGDVE